MPYCPNCGAKAGKTANFCMKCGFNIKEAEEEEEVGATIDSQKCALHPERDAVGVCADCGKGVCYFCQTVAGNKLYCPYCIDKILSRPIERGNISSTKAFKAETFGQEPLEIVKQVATARRLAANIPFTSGHLRALLVIFFMSIFIVLCFYAISADISVISLASRGLSGEDISYHEASVLADQLNICGSLQVLAFVITALFFCIWIYRAHKNLPALNAYHLKYTPGWAIGWYFIPILWWVYPYRVMREIWQASDPRGDVLDVNAWQNAPVSPLVGGWWAFYVIASIVATAARVHVGGAEDFDDILTGSYLYLAYDIAFIITAILAIMLIFNIDRRQREKHNSLTAYQNKDTSKLLSFSKDAVPDLVKALKDEDWRVRESAAEALGKIGPHAKAAKRDLGMIVSNENEDRDVRESAAEALKKIGREK
jgi:hypothetical protein